MRSVKLAYNILQALIPRSLYSLGRNKGRIGHLIDGIVNDPLSCQSFRESGHVRSIQQRDHQKRAHPTRVITEVLKDSRRLVENPGELLKRAEWTRYARGCIG